MNRRAIAVGVGIVLTISQPLLAVSPASTGPATTQASAASLDELLEGMKPETFPDDEGFGPAVGQEVW